MLGVVNMNVALSVVIFSVVKLTVMAPLDQTVNFKQQEYNKRKIYFFDLTNKQGILNDGEAKYSLPPHQGNLFY